MQCYGHKDNPLVSAKIILICNQLRLKKDIFCCHSFRILLKKTVNFRNSLFILASDAGFRTEIIATQVFQFFSNRIYIT